MAVIFTIAVSALVFYISGRSNAFNVVKFEKDSSIDMHVCYWPTALFFENVFHLTPDECLALCKTTTDCFGVFYSRNGACWGCGKDVLLGADSPDIVNKSYDTNFYRRVTLNTHGQLCTASSQCDTRQYCAASGKCICNHGYSYSATGDTCNTGCLVYGETYEAHTGWYINDHNMAVHVSASRAQCHDLCTRQPKCRTYDYMHYSETDDYKCMLQGETALTAPTDFKVARSHLTVHYQRNCHR